jgi:hypothetical protein
LDAEILRNHHIAFYTFTLTIHSLFASFLVSSFEQEVLLTDIMKMKIKITLGFCIAISTSALFYGSIETGVLGILIWALSFNVVREQIQKQSYATTLHYKYAGARIFLP